MDKQLPRFEGCGQFIDISCHEHPEVGWRGECVPHNVEVRGHRVSHCGVFQFFQLFLKKFQLGHHITDVLRTSYGEREREGGAGGRQGAQEVGREEREEREREGAQEVGREEREEREREGAQEVGREEKGKTREGVGQ